MTNDNETVEQVALSERPLAEQIRIIRRNYSIGSGEFDALDEAADVVECHQREIGELKGERKGILKANESLASDNTRLRGELAAKDEEIAELRALVGELADALQGCVKALETVYNLTNEEAHIFVDRAIAAGYTIDEDVPEDLIREWLGLTKSESEVE